MRSTRKAVPVASVVALVACLSGEAVLGQPELPPGEEAPTATGRRAWGPEQATGAPDTPEAGDRVTAWASLEPDGGPEWLRLGYAKAVHIAEVRIRESYSPGAVCQVSAFLRDGTETVLWQGEDPTRAAPSDFVVQAPQDVESASIQVYLDTRQVQSWNEIDAVELVGKDGSRQWAASAEASSTYADRAFGFFTMGGVGQRTPDDEGPDLFETLRQRPVTVHLEGPVTVQGTLVHSSGSALWLEDPAGNRKVLINHAKVLFAESPRAAVAPAEVGPERVFEDAVYGGDWFQVMLHLTATVHLEDQTIIRGLVTTVAGQALRLEDMGGARTIVVNRAKVLFAEAGPQE